jgi:pimeloyl-ACP methyl ester carboxylesterase
VNAPVSIEKQSDEMQSAPLLPRPLAIKTFDGLQGGLLLRPWYDWCAVRAIVNWYFPLSRAWAAALESQGDLEIFNRILGTRFGNSVRMRAALEQTIVAARACSTNQQQWEEAFFGGGTWSEMDLVATEVERQILSKRLMFCRRSFLPWRGKFPKLQWSIQSPEELERRHGERLRRPDTAFDAPVLPDFEVSRMVCGQWDADSGYRQYWLRFPSLISANGSRAATDAGSDERNRAWAKVYEPEDGATDAPCLIFLHGIGMETDFWGEMTDPVNMLTKKGFRVIRPEAPWHGHRRSAGSFGGEPVIAQGPLGFVELFHASVCEVAQLTEWARRTGSSKVAVGGLSLGALTAQIVAAQARNWVAERQPDNLLLVTTSENMLDVALQGSMARLLDMPGRFDEAGWTELELTRWTPLLEPHGDPVMAPGRIVMQLGQSDDLTPYPGGVSLMQRWRVPDANVFHRKQGHFSASLGLYRDPSVLERLTEIMWHSD